MQFPIVPLAGLALPVILVPMILFAKLAATARTHRHLERMQALKSGLQPQTPSPLGAGTVTAVGAGVPIASILAALIASSWLDLVSDDSIPMLAIIWFSAAILAVAAMTVGLVLALMINRARAQDRSTSPRDSAKPAYDPDMFEPAASNL